MSAVDAPPSGEGLEVQEVAATETVEVSKQVNPALRAAAERRKKDRHRAVPLIPEVRQWAATGLEVREQAGSNEIVIAGSPIVYDTPYVVTDKYGEFEERMAPGVAGKVLPTADVRFLFNHDGLPLARSLSGTLTLRDGERSLDFEARLDSRQQLANDLAVAIERGDVSQMSCGFVVSRDEWDSDYEHRTVFEFADLLDVSAVTYPASPTTSIAIARRMIADQRKGAVLSKGNLDKLVDLTKGAHSLLQSAGFDPRALIEVPAGDADDPTDTQTEDGSEGGNVGTGNGAGQDTTNPDGSGDFRSEDPGEPVEFLSAETAEETREEVEVEPEAAPINSKIRASILLAQARQMQRTGHLDEARRLARTSTP